MMPVVYFLATAMTIAEHDSPYVDAARAHRSNSRTGFAAALLLVLTAGAASAQQNLTPPSAPVTIDYGELDRLPGVTKPQSATQTPSAERTRPRGGQPATRFAPPPPPPKFEEQAHGVSAIGVVEQTTPPPPALLPAAPPPPPRLATPPAPTVSRPAGGASPPGAASPAGGGQSRGVAEVDAATPPPPPPASTGRDAATASPPSAPPMETTAATAQAPSAPPAPRAMPAAAPSTPPTATTAVDDEPKVTPAPRVPVESTPADASTPPPRPRVPQVAARPPAGVTVDATLLRLEFAAGSAELSDEARDALARRVETFKRDETARIQVQAFATGVGGSEPRRLSLSRALAVRAFFVERGIASTRIDVRALGERGDDGPLERVDVLTVRR